MISTLTDPNDGVHARYQYRLSGALLLRRRVPETADRWADDAIDEPWWEPMLELPPGGEIREFWERKRPQWTHTAGYDYAHQARLAAAQVVAYTPNGREVRRNRDGLTVQPHNDNYVIRVRDLREARRAYFHPEEF